MGELLTQQYRPSREKPEILLCIQLDPSILVDCVARTGEIFLPFSYIIIGSEDLLYVVGKNTFLIIKKNLG